MKFYKIIVAIIPVCVFQTAYSQDLSTALSPTNLKEYQQQMQIALITSLRPEARANFKDDENLRQRKLSMQQEILDLLHKSFFDQLDIINSSNQIKA